MIDKKHVKCIKKTHCGPFYDNFIVYIHNNEIKTNIYDLRIMNKPIIIKYEEEKLIQYEYFIRIKVRHPFLINILFSFQDYDNLFLISEYANTNFIEFMKLRTFFSKKISTFYISEIILAIEYLHSNDLTYGFFVPKNIFLNDAGHIKLKYDFLNSIIEKKDGIRDFIEYTSPEYIRTKSLGYSSDIWSIGILLYHMMVGYTPFYSESYEKTKCNILEAELTFPKYLDKDSVDLISKILEKDPKERINFNGIKSHAFFKKLDWQRIYKKQEEPPFFFKEIDKYKNATPADLNKIFTTDYYKEQNKDGYGKIFRYFGSMDVENPYVK
ncbi:hypothetical protein P3W45_000382 [Vairimorpha bombi]|jgi:serine/threonine protein kinase